MSGISFHPYMTGRQIAELCERHGLIIAITWTLDKHGKTQPIFTAMPEGSIPPVPDFLRPPGQAY